MALDPDRYVIGDDGLLVEKVGPWAKDKLEIVGDYIQISGATRRKYRENRPAFIDVFCGPGRSLASLNTYGLHFALLDPHNLGALSFSIIEQLAKLKYVDILVHVSVSDLQRNVDLYSSEVQRQFDEFAPQWRKHVSLNANLQSVRAAMIEYWSDLVQRLGLPRAKHTELIKGTGNQRLYWLMLLSRRPTAHKFWDKITLPAIEPTMF
jgi:hypothetical protein